MKMEMEMHDMLYVVWCMYVWTVREGVCGGWCTLQCTLYVYFVFLSLPLSHTTLSLSVYVASK